MTIKPDQRPAYCVSGQESQEASRKVRAWLAAKAAAGCTVEWKICGTDNLGVVWQVVNDPAHPYSEFSDYIDMTGCEGRMN
jgi:hypothetical protein